MTPDEFADAVADRNETALSRLGSSKSLYADTRGEMEPDAVRRALGSAHYHAAAAFEAWAEGEADAAVETWTAAADAIEETATAIADDPEAFDPGEPPATVTAFEDADGPATRAGALYGWALAQEKKASQATGFFVGQADPSTADAFRDVGSTLEELQEQALAVLESGPADDATDAALEAADGVIQAAYEEYVAALEALGVNPKPVC